MLDELEKECLRLKGAVATTCAAFGARPTAPRLYALLRDVVEYKDAYETYRAARRSVTNGN